MSSGGCGASLLGGAVRRIGQREIATRPAEQHMGALPLFHRLHRQNHRHELHLWLVRGHHSHEVRCILREGRSGEPQGEQ